MLVGIEVANADSRAAPIDCSTKPFTIWHFSSRHGVDVSTNANYNEGDELQPHEGAYEPRKTTWTGISSKKGPVLVVHFVHPSVHNPTKRSSSGPICVFSPGKHRVERLQGRPA